MSTFADLPTFLHLHLCWVNAQQLSQIKRYFGDVKSALQANENEWRATKILSVTQLEKLFSDATKRDVESALQWGEISNQGWLSWDDSFFPQRCLQIEDAPILLGYKGSKSLLNDPQIAIVGSRHASKSGQEVAEDFAHFLSDKGLTITSGLALGIDAAAHRGGLQGVGKTIAVVATGLDRIYPASNKLLGQQIVEEGVMVSEFALGTKPINYNFPKRNRIISGLSYGTLVVEAALKSGSLITARTSMEQGRDVFAVPGSIHNPQAKGCHQLIKQGAKLVESGQDILEELSTNIADALKGMSSPENLTQVKQETSQLELLAGSSDSKRSVSQPNENLAASGLLKFIDFEPVTLDELVVVSKMPVSSIQSELMMLELSGQVEALSGARWRRIR